VSGDKVYVGGYFVSIGGRAYNHLAALDVTTAQATYWYPNPDSYVYAIAVSGDIVYAGGSFWTVFGTPHATLVGLKPASTVGVETPASSLPIRLGATPNPSRAGFELSFALPENTEVDASVYDLGGRLVRRLERSRLPAGEQHLFWDGRNDAGREVSTGFYVVRVRAGGVNLNTKILRLK